MTLFLTGSPTRFGEPAFTEDNGFLAEVKAALTQAAGGLLPRVLLVSAAPDDEGFTASVRKGMSDCIHASGIETAEIVIAIARMSIVTMIKGIYPEFFFFLEAMIPPFYEYMILS